MRLIDADALITYCNDNWIPLNVDAVNAQSTIQPELTDEQSIAHLQSSGWMQKHDKEMYESGLKEQLTDDSDSYVSLLPTVQFEPHWIPCSERLPDDDKEVLLCINNGELWLGWHNITWKTEEFYFDKEQVIAWMPLPEPHKGGEM